MMGSAKATAAMLMIIVSAMVMIRAWTRMLLALSRLFSPLRLATRAETATFKEIKTARQMNFGWVVSPTAAMAKEPRELTITVSISPTNATRKDSKMEGQATSRALRNIARPGGMSPKGSEPWRKRFTSNNRSAREPAAAMKPPSFQNKSCVENNFTIKLFPTQLIFRKSAISTTSAQPGYTVYWSWPPR